MQDSQNANFSALTIQISSRLGCWHSIHLAISYSCIVVCEVLDCTRNEKHVQQNSFMCAAHICEIVSAGVFTSAGNLFKFCCQASTEYQVVVVD